MNKSPIKITNFDRDRFEFEPISDEESSISAVSSTFTNPETIPESYRQINKVYESKMH
jgi:hypothetical protein